MDKYTEPYKGLLVVTVGLEWSPRCSQLPYIIALVLKRAKAASFSVYTTGMMAGSVDFTEESVTVMLSSFTYSFYSRGARWLSAWNTGGKSQRSKTTDVVCLKQVKRDTGSIPLAMKYTNSFSLGHQCPLQLAKFPDTCLHLVPIKPPCQSDLFLLFLGGQWS